MRGRKPYSDPRIQRCIQVPKTLLAALENHLTDPSLGRKPHGALSRYIEALIRQDLGKQELGFKLICDPLIPADEIHVRDPTDQRLQGVLICKD